MKATYAKIGMEFTKLLALPRVTEMDLPTVYLGKATVHLMFDKLETMYFVVAVEDGVIVRLFHRCKRPHARPNDARLARRNILRDECAMYFFKHIVRNDTKFDRFMAKDRTALKLRDNMYFKLREAHIATHVGTAAHQEDVWEVPSWAGRMQAVINGIPISFFRRITFSRMTGAVTVTHEFRRSNDSELIIKKEYPDRQWQTSKVLLAEWDILTLLKMA